MTIGTKLYTAVFGKKIGADEFGNKYFTNKGGKRWVIYNGIAEASKVPAAWHRWLHKTTDEAPEKIKKHKWEKPHLPNLTGTINAYLPDNHPSKLSAGAKKPQSYSAWTPEE